MKKIFLILVALVLSNGCENAKNTSQTQYSHYDIQLQIKPDEQFIKANGVFDYVVADDSLTELSFNLHKSMQISEFTVNGAAVQVDSIEETVRWIPDAVKLNYTAKQPFHKGDVLNIKFAYQGNITQWPEWSANVLTPDWIEMGLYFPWYPSTWGEFTYKLAVEIDPEYNVFALGEPTEKKNIKIFEKNSPVFDLIVCASKDLTVRETTLLGHSFQIVNSSLSDATIDSMQADIQNFYTSFSNWFGNIEFQNMCFVVSGRKKGGGYARPGALFLGGLSDSLYMNQRIDNIKYLAHEIAHFWWTGAPGTWEDWLNENLAEYSALRLIRDLYSSDEFESRMDIKRQESANTPPIWDMPRNDPQAQQVLYSKGVVLLNELESRIGPQKFLELCKARVEQKANTTTAFLDLLNDIAGNENRDWLELTLRIR